MRVELEVCDAGLPFADAACTRRIGAGRLPVDTTTLGVLIEETIDGLTERELVRWRARGRRGDALVVEDGAKTTNAAVPRLI